MNNQPQVATTNNNSVINPKKTKTIIIILSIALGISVIGAGVLGYYYYKTNKNLKEKNLKLDDLGKKTNLSATDLNLQLSVLKSQNDKLTTENEQLQKDKTGLKTSVDDKTTKMTKAKTYNDVLVFLANLMSTHGGFDGWTEAEHAEGIAIAQTTNDQSFVDLVEWAWQHEEISQVERLTPVLKSIAGNVNTNLKQ